MDTHVHTWHMALADLPFHAPLKTTFDGTCYPNL